MTRLSQMAWPDVAGLAGTGTILLVPVGSTEQHGLHLPFTTDTDIAVALVERASGHLPSVVVAPPVSYGSSGEHQGFAGTLSIGRRATELLLVELGRSARLSFEHLVLVSTHGGNSDPLTQAVASLRSEGVHTGAWAPSWPSDPHAGHTETSIMLAIAPDRVLWDRAEPGDTRPIADLLPLLRTEGVAAASANGVLGDPTGASPEAGRDLIEDAVGDLVEFLIQFRGVESMEVSR